MPVFTLSNRALNALANPEMPLTGVFYAQLMLPSFTFNPKTHDTMAAITSGEITPVSGYQAGGKPVTLSNTMNTTTGINTLTIAPFSWNATVTGAQKVLIYYRPSTTPSLQIVLGCNDIGSPQNSVGGLFRLEEMIIETAVSGSSSIVVPHATINAIINETLNLSAGNFWAMLLGTGYTPSPSHSFRSNLSAEVTGTGYTAGGVAAPLTITRNDALDEIIVRAEQIIHPAFTASPRYVAYYQKLGGAASADRVVMIVDWGIVYPATGSVYPINPNEIIISGVYS
jgi:hypothetical protein